jgi:biotin-dependent carboxylase-like uncharacterized protein
MSRALKVLQPGVQTTVQDLGRTGFQAQGIPVSGAVDTTALRAANIVVGNSQATAGLEIALVGPTLEVLRGSVRVAVAGGQAAIEIMADNQGEARRVPALQSVTLAEGQRFRIGPVSGSAVACLAIEGGIELPPFLGSLSTYTRGGFGGFEGRALREGDVLALRQERAEERPEVRVEHFPLVPPHEPIRVVLGPQDDYFTPEALETFLSAVYVVTREADRMGLRLDGPKLTHSKGANIVSDGIAPGAIQVPGNGLPIVLLADRQTAGGYPKIATVISADIPALGRVSPGHNLRFTAVSIEEAQRARRLLEDTISAVAGNLVRAGIAEPDLSRLLSVNLVSGVVNARE